MYCKTLLQTVSGGNEKNHKNLTNAYPQIKIWPANPQYQET